MGARRLARVGHHLKRDRPVLELSEHPRAVGEEDVVVGHAVDDQEGAPEVVQVREHGCRVVPDAAVKKITSDKQFAT